MALSKKHKNLSRQAHINRLEKLYDSVYQNAMMTGYGFLIVKQCNRHGIMITQASWLEIREILNDMGATGAFGGPDKPNYKIS